MADNQASNPKENMIRISTGSRHLLGINHLHQAHLHTSLGLGLGPKIEAKPPADPVNHPSHYTAGGMEVLDILQAKLTPEEFRGFLKGNVLKYVMREKYKGGLQDLEKAQFYLTRLIEDEKAALSPPKGGQ